MSIAVSSFRRRTLVAATGLALLCSLAACKKDTPAAADPNAAATPAAAPALPPAQAVSSQVASMGVDQLREAASKAMTEQRLYAPAGNNALEYFVALRDKANGDPTVASALTDLLPYALMATEQSIDRDDFAEAQRLYALMEKADAQAPALPRLKKAIADAQASYAQRMQDRANATDEEKKRLAELDKKRLEDQKKAQEEAARQLATQRAAEDRATADRAAAAKAEADRAAAAKAEADRVAAAKAEADRVAAQRAAAAQPAAPRPAPAASNELRAISTPQPKFPPEALRSGQSGEVIVEFTVAPNGTVSDARVVRANPPRVFDREALAAVKRWRFQPVGSPVTTRRTIGFSPGQ